MFTLNKDASVILSHDKQKFIVDRMNDTLIKRNNSDNTKYNKITSGWLGGKQYKFSNISTNVQTSSKQIEGKTKEILTSIESLRNSSANMSNNFHKIVSTTEATKETTNNLQYCADEMSEAVDNISNRIEEFKV